MKPTATNVIVNAILAAALLAASACVLEGVLLLYDGTLRQRDLYAFYAKGDVWTFQRAAAARREGQPFDTRTMSEALSDARANDRSTAVFMSPSVFFLGKAQVLPQIAGRDTLPLAGISRTATLLCNESGSFVTYRSDEHGFRNPEGLYEGPLDVALIGDSFAQGWCVPSATEPAAIIREHYRAINLAVAGAGPLTMLAIVREYAERLRPRVVVWCFYEGNDLFDLEHEQSLPALARYFDPAFRQDVWTRQPSIDAAWRTVAERMLNDSIAAQTAPVSGARLVVRHVRNFLRLALSREWLRIEPWRVGRPEPPQPATVERFAEVLRQGHEAVTAWGGQLVLAYLPDIGTFDRYSRSRPYRAGVLAAAARLGIPVLDAEAEFASAPDPLAFWPARQQGHYNERGHRRLAELILKHLQGALPARSPEDTSRGR